MGPSPITIEHARSFDAERHHSVARSERSRPRLAAARAVIAVALVVSAFAVLAATASARAIDAPGLPTPHVTSSGHVAPAPSSDGPSVATVGGLIAGALVLLAGGSVGRRVATGSRLRTETTRR